MVLVVKDCDIKAVEKACLNYGLPCVIVEQSRGLVTTALNMGKKESSGDIMLFTDDDAIAPRGWIKRYVKAFSNAPKDVGCISSRDVYIKLDRLRIVPTVDDYPHIKLYRWLVRTWFEPPLRLLREYRFGVYISKGLNVVHGPYLPSRACLSLPYRGVNMGFRGEITNIIEFPEHPKLKRALGFEQYIGLQLVFERFKSMYTPKNPILHIYREESLSRTKRYQEELMMEMGVMKTLYARLLKEERC